MITVADARPAIEPAARLGFMSTLLWDFVQLDITLVLVWIGIQLGLRPVKKLRDEIACAALLIAATLSLAARPGASILRISSMTALTTAVANGVGFFTTTCPVPAAA